MTSVLTKTDQEAEIRARLDAWAKAAGANDVDAVMSHYAPDVVAFDAIAALQFQGAEAYRRHWQACLVMCTALFFEIHDLSISARDDLAFGHYLVRCGGAGPDGKEHSGWMRATVCLRKMNGNWMIVHEHLSAPFDPESGKALLELKPQHAEPTSAA